jgi:hypothetical protein
MDSPECQCQQLYKSLSTYTATALRISCYKLHVGEIIKALTASTQCMKANTEVTKMNAKTPSGEKKSRSKKGRSEQGKPRRKQRQALRAMDQFVDGMELR